MIHKQFSGFALLGLATLSLAGCDAFLELASSTMCGNTVIQEVPSPNGQKKVVFFERNCGATTEYSQHLSVLKSNERLPNLPGNALTAYLEPKDLFVKWETNNQLGIHYPKGDRVYDSSTKVNDTNIRFETYSY